MPVKIVLEDGSVYAQKGTLEFIGTSVDTGTGNVSLRAMVPNPDGLLLPGTYVKAVMPSAVNDKAILLSQSVVSRNTRGEPVVKLVAADGKVEERLIQTGDAIKDQWVVTSGLKEGEQVIVSGGSNARGGQQVQIADKSAAAPAQPASAASAASAAAGQ